MVNRNKWELKNSKLILILFPLYSGAGKRKKRMDKLRNQLKALEAANNNNGGRMAPQPAAGGPAATGQ